MSENIITEIRKPNFHALLFTYKGVKYSFAGWWILDWGTGDKEYDSVDDFLNDPLFNGKTLAEIENELVDVDFEFEP